MDGFISGTAYWNDTYVAFPRLKLTEKQKIKEYGSVKRWAEMCIESIDNSLSYGNTNWKRGYLSEETLKENLDLVEYGIFNNERFKSLTGIYGDSVKFPVELEHYDIISNRLEALLGEELLKKLEYRVVNKSADVASAAQEHKMSIIRQFYEMHFKAGVQQAAMQNGEQPSIDTSDVEYNDQGKPQMMGANGSPITNLDQLLRYAEASFSDMSEVIGNQVLEYLWSDLRLDRVFHKGFRTLWATGQEVYYVGASGGEPYIRNVDLRNFDYDLSSGEDNISKAAFIREIRYLTVAEILDLYWDSLTDSQIEQLEITKGHIGMFGNYLAQGVLDNDNIVGVRVAHFEWQAMIKVGIRKYYDEMGVEVEEIVDDKYKGTSEDTIDWFWLPQRWEGTKIGSDIYVNVQPLEFQFRGIDNLGQTFSHYCGLRVNYSLVDKIKPYQYLYNVVMYQLKLAFARAKGKAILIDISQIPKGQGWDIDKWLYYLDMFGVAAINSNEKNSEGERSQFNQFQQFDLTLGNTINSYIMQLEFLKNEIADITGITEQRLGNIKSTETVGGVERSVMQSSAITESLFFIHREVVREVLQAVLDVTKFIWKSGKKVSYVLNDLQRKFFEVTDANFLYEDMGVFISNSTKDMAVLQTLKQMAQQMFASKEISLSEYVNVLKSNSIKDIEYFAKEAGNRQESMMQQQQQMQQQQMQQQGAMAEQQFQLQMQKEQLQMQIEQEKLVIEQQKLELEKYKIDLQEANKLEIAKIKAESDIYAFNSTIEADANRNGVLDMFEKERMDLEKMKLQMAQLKEVANMQKQELDAQFKQKQLEQNEDKMVQEQDRMDQEMALKEKELAIKRMQANKPQKS